MARGPCVDAHTSLITDMILLVVCIFVDPRISVLDFKFVLDRDKTCMLSLFCLLLIILFPALGFVFSAPESGFLEPAGVQSCNF